MISGSSGIGAATARLAAERDVRVFLCSLDAAESAALAEELGQANHYHAGDLSDAAVAQAAVAKCLEHLGPIDAVFNVAGGSGRRYGDGPVHQITDDGWHKTFEINLTTMFNLTRAVLPGMMEHGGGSIVQMATVTAFSPQPGHFATHAYAAAKGAVISLTKAMAAYYAPHAIRVNALAPGLVRTPMSQRAQNDESILELMRTKQPLASGLIEPTDVARAAYFLMSGESRMITGEILTVDAGWRWN